MKTSGLRIASIDIFRALTMFLMIFVNDIPKLGDSIPHFLHHATRGEDMLGFSDIIFPCFLFCVGLSIPLAVQNRLSKGGNYFQLFSHIAQRTTALLVMGLFSSNNFYDTAKITGIASPLLKIISIIAFFMIWNLYPKAAGIKKKIFSALQVSGWVILALLALLFVRPAGQNEVTLASSCIPIGFSGSPQYIFQYAIFALCALFPIITDFLQTRNLLKLVAKTIAFVVVFYLFLFKGTNTAGLVGMRPGWWQILGLIGWTYFFAVLIFTLTKNKIRYNMVAWLFFTFLCISANTGWAEKTGVAGFIPGNGSHLSLAFAGIIASLWLQRNQGRENFKKLGLIYIAGATLLFTAATVAHRYFIISKMQETCTWIFYCTAIAVICLMFIHWLADIKDKKSWFKPIKPAGTSTLTCYLIPYVWYSVESLTSANYPTFMLTGIGGLVKAFVLAFVIIGTAWLLGKLKIQLKI
jgi:predicted acyltransferase